MMQSTGPPLLQLAHREYGEAGMPAVVLLHGLLASRDNWHGFAHANESRFFFVVPDLVNHGRSPHVDQFGYPSMAHDVVTLMDSVGIGQAQLVGHSMGGKVAMEVALSYPERVVSLVVEDSSPEATSAEYLEPVEALRGIDLSKAGSRKDVERFLAQSLEDSMLRLFLLKNLERTGDGSYRWRANLNAIADCYDEIRAPLRPKRSYGGPALFIRGGRSDEISSARVSGIRSFFPAASVRTVESAGHWIHALYPEEFDRLVVPFLMGSNSQFEP